MKPSFFVHALKKILGEDVQQGSSTALPHADALCDAALNSGNSIKDPKFVQALKDPQVRKSLNDTLSKHLPAPPAKPTPATKPQNTTPNTNNTVANQLIKQPGTGAQTPAAAPATAQPAAATTSNPSTAAPNATNK